MFNDKYELTKAVLEGRKTQTRRFVKLKVYERGSLVSVPVKKIIGINNPIEYFFECNGEFYELPKENYPRYKVGEIVAVAQRYKEIENDGYIDARCSIHWYKGYCNKMFVKA